ncbi:MAG TPA: hypothetical protein VGJ83_06705 [Gemmatimonadales bacterium]
MTVGRSDGRMVGLMVTAALLSISPTVRLFAQDTTRATPPAIRVVPTDTVHRVRPMGAFWRSLLVPGWGQAATGRHTTGALFVAWEGVTAMMTLKARQEVNYMKATHAVATKLKRQEVQDWAVLWVFNHLFAGAEAYVSAHLQDFPRDLHLHAVPNGLGISIPLRGRP